MKNYRRLRHALVLTWTLLASVSVLPPPAAADPEHPEPLAAFPRSLLSVRTQSGSVLNFQVWIADTPAREEQGLMYVKQMDDHEGMLFVFPSDQRLSMWMKNTYLPLDMLFMDSQGAVVALIANATPLSLEILSPTVASRAVLELKGGAAATFGIHLGDHVLHKSFGTPHN